MSNHWIWDYKVTTYIFNYIKANMANYHLNKMMTIDNNTLQINFFCFGRQLEALSL